MGRIIKDDLKYRPKYPSGIPNYDITKDEIFKKYSNKTTNLGLRKKRASLAPYVGPWNKNLAIHLIRRTMFGAKPSDVASLASLNANDAVDTLLNTIPGTYNDPVNYYENIYPDTTGVAYGASWVNANYGDGTINYYRKLAIKADWTKLIMNQNTSIFEKMVLFWHNHFSTQTAVTDDARFLHRHQQLLRQYALGNFKDFVRDITIDASMLIYLNGQYNNKFAPDENYARELQELFTVGKEGGQPFAEADVKEAAKVLTGWRVDYTGINIFYDDTWHDTNNKQFSSFYGNTVITGQTGATGGATELDDLLNMIFSGQSAVYTAKNICRKLYRYFVYYDIDSTIETDIITPLATTFINSNWNILPVLEQLLKSSHFFDSLSQGCFIRTPQDHITGFFRTTNVQNNYPTDIELTYRHYFRINDLASDCGMDLGDPPNVSGWKPFYQIPAFHELWINSDTLPKRMRHIDDSLGWGIWIATISPGVYAKFNIDGVAFATSMSNPSDPDALVADFAFYLYGIDVSTTKKNQLKISLLDASLQNAYWTQAWNDYIGSPGNTTFFNIVDTRIKNLLLEMSHMAEHFLC